jgi:hypothetical protein
VGRGRATKVARILTYGSPAAAMLDSGLVVVPNLLGLTLADVLTIVRANLITLATSGDRAGVDVGAVVEQTPSAGTEVSPGSAVTVRFGDDPGDAGVREPRRPVPPVRHDSAAADLPLA